MAEQEKKEEKSKPQFDKTTLSPKDQEYFKHYETRITQLQLVRKNHYGQDLDKLWDEADKNYVPHRLGSSEGRKGMVENDENSGWRNTSKVVTLGASDWQSDVSQANPFIKIQTALAILIDQNPTGVFTPMVKKFQATTELIKQLYQRSWEFARSKAQLVLFVFNLAKYGWAVARTYPLKINRKVRVLKAYNPDKPDEAEYEEKEVCEYNDIFRKNLNPHNVWIDDQARPNNPMSIKDWAWREVYDFDVATEEFGKFKNWEFVSKGGNTSETITSVNKQQEPQSNNLIEIYFYENRVKDLFMVIANGVPVVIEPLPISDSDGHKKLSLWQTFWMLRHAESPYGIGVYEAIRFDHALKDRIRNMTIDQLTMSIYKMFFYTGTGNISETGDITIAPGVGKQVLDPKNVNWLDVPGPGQEAWAGLDMLQKDVDNASAITEPLLGEVTGKTAFEIAQAKESALKRLKQPLENIQEALNTEGYITVSLIQLLYSIPETYEIADQRLIEDYLKEIEFDQELYEEGEPLMDEMTGDSQRVIKAKIYPEFPLNLDKDEKGNLIETNETKFFRIKPKYLTWNGLINIKAQSLLTPSKQIDKALELEMYNMLIPLLAQPPEIYSKVAKSIVKLYDKDPRDILPPEWLVDPAEQQAAQQELFISPDQAAQQQQPGQPGQPPGAQPGQPPPAGMPPAGGGAPAAPKLVPSVQAPSQQPPSVVGAVMNKINPMQ